MPAGKDEIRALARRGLLDSALALCRRGLEADSADVFAAFMSAKLVPEGQKSADYFRKVQASKSASQAGSAASPELEESYFRLGQFHYAAGKYYLAIPFFRDYLRLYPAGDWKEPAHYWMGNACFSFAQSRPEKTAYLDTGLVYLQKLLEKIGPENYYYALAWEGVAKIKAAKGDAEGAWEAASTALDKAPVDERPPITLLAAQLRHGVNRAEEKALLEKLVSQYPQSLEVRYLRRLNGDADPSKWRSGTGPVRLAAPVSADSAKAAPAKGPDTVTAKLPTRQGPAAQAPQPPENPAVTSGGFTLQLGAFAQAANAQTLAAGIRKLGLSPEIIESERSGKHMYQVRLGRFASADMAQEFANRNLKPNRIMFQTVPAP
jgi:cell division septation protein DedD